MATAEDICIGRFPPIIVNARGQLRDVIRRTIALDAGDFAKIVDGVTCLAGASTDPYKKKSPRGFSRLSQDFNDVINPNRVNPSRYLLNLRKVSKRVFSRAHYALDWGSKVLVGAACDGIIRSLLDPYLSWNLPSVSRAQ